MRKIELASWRGFEPTTCVVSTLFMKITNSQKIEVIISMNLFRVKGWEESRAIRLGYNCGVALASAKMEISPAESPISYFNTRASTLLLLILDFLLFKIFSSNKMDACQGNYCAQLSLTFSASQTRTIEAVFWYFLPYRNK